MIVNCSRKDSDRMWENLASVVKWLITGTVYLHLVLILTLLTCSRSMYLLSWNQKLN